VHRFTPFLERARGVALLPCSCTNILQLSRDIESNGWVLNIMFIVIRVVFPDISISRGSLYGE